MARTWLRLLVFFCPVFATAQTDWLNQVKNKPFVDSRQYNFPIQTPGGSLVVGANSVTLRPFPQGLTGSDTQHYLYVSSGTGTAESCLVTGGTGTGGSASGVIQITCANTHSGAWTIQSASSGIKEASIANPASTIMMPIGVIPIHKYLIIPTNISLVGQGSSTASAVTLGTVLSCDAAASPCMVIADGNGTATGQGIGFHSGYTMYSPSGAASGLWIGGDPAGVITPSGWTGSYVHFNSQVTNFQTGIQVNGGNFDVFTGGASHSLSRSLYIPSSNTGECQPLEFQNFLLDSLDKAVVMDASGFGSCPIHFGGGQVSGIITGASLNWDAEGVHYEPNFDNIPIVNISSQARFRSTGGIMSVHGTALTCIICFSGTAVYNVLLNNTQIQAGVGMVVTEALLFDSSVGGTLYMSGNVIEPAGTITNLYSIPNAVTGLTIGYSRYAGKQSATAAATLAFPQSNYPVSGILEVTGTTVGGSGITAVSGIFDGQTGSIYTDNIQTFTAGATIGATITTTAAVVYTFGYHNGKIWIK